MSEEKPPEKARRTAVGTVISYVENGISENLFVEGRLPTESDIATSVGVSRTPVREAMKILDAIGIIEIRRGIGTFLSPHATTAIGYLMMFSTVTKSATPQQLFESRLMVEQAAAELVSNRQNPTDLAQIRAANEKLRKLAEVPEPDLDAVTEADIDFHRIIFDLCGNPLIAAIGKLTIEQVRPWIRTSHETEGPMLSVHIHEDMIEAIAQKNSGIESQSIIARAVRNSLSNWRGRLLGNGAE